MLFNVFEMGFNFSQDGPGNRLVVHLAGCNLRCPWCSNPEGMKISDGKCTPYSQDELYEKIVSAKPMFFSGGGVTFTGGECTLYNSELKALLSRLKNEGIHTAIESNAATDSFCEIGEECDYVIADYKSPDKEKLKRITAAELELVENNIFTIAKKRPIHLRIPLIHGFNDSADDLDGFVRFFSRLSKEAFEFDVEILPYHEYGKDKWKALGLQYDMENGHVDSKTVELLKNALENEQIKINKS